MARRKKLKARLFQVWLKSALDKLDAYWLHFASPDPDRAMIEYRKLRRDYYKAELRDETGHVLASHDEARVDNRRRQDWMDNVFSPEETVSESFKSWLMQDRADNHKARIERLEAEEAKS